MSKARKPSSLARDLGAFVGHIVRGVKTQVVPEEGRGVQARGAGGGAAMGSGHPYGEGRAAEGPQTIEVARQTQTSERVTPMGRVMLRRTVIDEVIVPEAGAAEPPTPETQRP